MARNKSNLKFQMMKKLDSLAMIGHSKHFYQMRNKARGLGYKSDFIHSIRTLEIYKDEASRFCSWLADNGYTFKKLDDIPRSVVGDYIKSRDCLSAWTSHLSLAAMNKLGDYGLTTRELGLKSRRIQDIHNNRGFSSSRPIVEEKYKDAITFIKSSGIRRSSVSSIAYRHFVFDKTGSVEAIKTYEKGGKFNTYYVLPEYRPFIDKYISDFYSSHSRSTPLFSDFDPHRHINCHWFRNEYSCNLYSQLKNEFENGKPFYNDSDYLNYAINSSKVAANFRKHGDIYKGHDTMVLSLLSQSLGHYRLDVCTNHYLRFDCISK